MHEEKSFVIHTTTYESSNQPYMSKTLKILCIFVRAFEQTSHVHVNTQAAIVG